MTCLRSGKVFKVLLSILEYKVLNNKPKLKITKC